jgi:hypothetical protein
VMFELDCETSLTSPAGPLRVNCFGSRDIASVECSYDNGAIVEACEHVHYYYVYSGRDGVQRLCRTHPIGSYSRYTYMYECIFQSICNCGAFWAIPTTHP